MFVGESAAGTAWSWMARRTWAGASPAPGPWRCCCWAPANASYDVLSMLRKSRQQVVDCQVELEAERADASTPRCLPASPCISRGNRRGAQESQVKRAVGCRPKCCSASIMLRCRRGAIGPQLRNRGSTRRRVNRSGNCCWSSLWRPRTWRPSPGVGNRCRRPPGRCRRGAVRPQHLLQYQA